MRRGFKPCNGWRSMESMKNVVLTGFMGTGKSEVGKALAKRLGYIYVDTDTEVEKQRGMKISDIFGAQGEAAFRDMEAEVIRRLSEGDKLVIATGGGAVLREENMENLRKKGVIVCLNASAEAILNRVNGNSDRPLLQVEDPLARIREMLAERRPYYERADIVMDTEDRSPLEIADDIIGEMKGL
jgi:shikimate kinase